MANYMHYCHVGNANACCALDTLFDDTKTVLTGGKNAEKTLRRMNTRQEQ